MKKQRLIPECDIILAANEVGKRLAAAGKYCCADKWGEAEKSLCRSLLPPQYTHIESDIVGHYAVAARKAGKLNGDPNHARKKYEEPKGEYAKYLESDHWRKFRERILTYWDYRCCLCSSNNKLEVHHRTYARIGREADNDCVCLCHTCHRKVHGGMQDGNAEFERGESSLWT